MNTLITMLAIAIPNALMAIASKVFTEKMAQMVIEKIIIFGLRKLAKLSTSTVDDKIVEDVVKQIQGENYAIASE